MRTNKVCSSFPLSSSNKDLIFLADECRLTLSAFLCGSHRIWSHYEREHPGRRRRRRGESHMISPDTSESFCLSLTPLPPLPRTADMVCIPITSCVTQYFSSWLLLSSVTRLLFLHVLGIRNLAVFHFTCSCSVHLPDSLTSSHTPSFSHHLSSFPHVSCMFLPLPLLRVSLRPPATSLLLPASP